MQLRYNKANSNTTLEKSSKEKNNSVVNPISHRNNRLLFSEWQEEPIQTSIYRDLYTDSQACLVGFFHSPDKNQKSRKQALVSFIYELKKKISVKYYHAPINTNISAFLDEIRSFSDKKNEVFCK